MTVPQKPATRKTVRGAAGSQRVVVRATPEQKLLLQQAAQRAGQSVAGFVLQSALRGAEETLGDQNVLRLSPRDSLAFAEAILSDKPAGPALRAGAERYRAFMEGR